MIHAAAAIPNLIYASDTHYPWNAASDVVRETDLFQLPRRRDRAVGRARPGRDDRRGQARRRARGVQAARRGSLARDDVGAMRERKPDWLPHMPKW